MEWDKKSGVEFSAPLIEVKMNVLFSTVVNIHKNIPSYYLYLQNEK